MSNRLSTDHNLLFGVLALQADFLTSAQFAEACSAWAARKDRPLADLLVERGWLTAEDRAHVDYLLARKLAKHSSDAHASLAAVATCEIKQVLAQVQDPEVSQSLAGEPGQPSTTAYQPARRQRYTLTRLHARGGIGQVWLARDEDLGRDVALKELLPERGDSAAIRARLLDEARITGQLEHPGIVPVYELARPSGGEEPFYTMRFVRGRTLADAIKAFHREPRANPLALRDLLETFVAVCNAVAYAHSRGVLHRDLKPQNVVLGDFGEVMVLDWGLARIIGRPGTGASLPPVALDAKDAHLQTAAGQALGTPAYMAPEQAEGRSDLIDERTDVYGLGAVLYEILTGQPPFAGDRAEDIIRQVIHDRPIPPRQRVARISRPLEAICLKAMAKKPADRYPSVRGLLDDTKRWLALEPVAVYRESWGERFGRWQFKRGKSGVPRFMWLWFWVSLWVAALMPLGIFAVHKVYQEQISTLRKANEDLLKSNKYMVASSLKLLANAEQVRAAVEKGHASMDFTVAQEAFMSKASASSLYEAARVYARSAGRYRQDELLAERYGMYAVSLLRLAAAKGWRDVDQLRKSPEFDPVRVRADFKALLKELEKRQ